MESVPHRVRVMRYPHHLGTPQGSTSQTFSASSDVWHGLPALRNMIGAFLTRYLTLGLLMAECLVATLFVCPLPPGFRNKLLEMLNGLWDSSPSVRHAVFFAGGISALVFADALYTLQYQYYRTATDLLEYYDAERNACLAGFSLFMILFEYRVQSLLRHYMAKIKKSEKNE